MEFDRLSKIQLDVLREVGNIGAGNAVTSMAQLINKKVNMKIPAVNVVTFDQMMEIVGGPEAIIVAMYFRIHGEAPGTVYFVLTIEKAETLINEMVQDPSVQLFENGETNDLAISVLAEVSNIMTGSYLSALSDFLNINMQSSVPNLSIDMAGAVLIPGLIEVSQVSDYAIVIDTEITDEQVDSGVDGHFFLLPDVESLPKIFTALGIENHE